MRKGSGAMREKRLKLDDRTSVYHTMSRIVGNERLFKNGDKMFMEQQMMKVSLFTGVEVIDYVLMDNHFHLLLRVHAKIKEMSDGELVRRSEILYGQEGLEYMRIRRVLMCEEPKEELEAVRFRREKEELRKVLIERMNDLSMFMKMFKQRTSIGFNGKRKRFGTLWSERFKSILIENDPNVIIIKSVYLGLNPVRAGMVKDPREYLFSGYGRAMRGNKMAREGLMSIGSEFVNEGWEVFEQFYAQILFGKGSCREKANQAVISNERVDEVMALGKEKMQMAEQLRKKMPYFGNGEVLGTRKFVESVYGGRLSLRADGNRKRRRPLVGVVGVSEAVFGKGGEYEMVTLKPNRERVVGRRRRCET
jgi:putative transposase